MSRARSCPARSMTGRPASPGAVGAAQAARGADSPGTVIVCTPGGGSPAERPHPIGVRDERGVQRTGQFPDERHRARRGLHFDALPRGDHEPGVAGDDRHESLARTANGRGSGRRSGPPLPGRRSPRPGPGMRASMPVSVAAAGAGHRATGTTSAAPIPPPSPAPARPRGRPAGAPPGGGAARASRERATVATGQEHIDRQALKERLGELQVLEQGVSEQHHEQKGRIAGRRDPPARPAPDSPGHRRALTHSVRSTASGWRAIPWRARPG